MVSSLTFQSLIHFEFILMYSVRRLFSVFFFCRDLSNFPNTIYCIDSFYPIVSFCLLCRILIDHKGVDLFLSSLFCSIDLYVCFYTSTMILDYYSLIVQFDIRQRDTSNFVLLSQGCCGSVRSFLVLYKFLEYLFQLCETHYWYLDRNCIESVYSFGQYGHLNDVISSYP